jgi:hypothetical protein
MNMACTFCPQGRAVPAFYGTRNLPASAGHAVGKQSRAWNPRFLILRDQLLCETSPRVTGGCVLSGNSGRGNTDNYFLSATILEEIVCPCDFCGMANLTPEDEAFLRELGRRAEGKTTPGTAIFTKAGRVAISNGEKQRLNEIEKRCRKPGKQLINQYL